MTTMYEPTGSQVLRSRSRATEHQGRIDGSSLEACLVGKHDVWTSTFMETSSSSWLRNAAAHFSGALDARPCDQVQIAVIRHRDGQVDLPDYSLWLAGAHFFIAGAQADEEPARIANETADVLEAFERIQTELGLTQKEMFKATGINKRTFHSWAEKLAGTRPRVASLGRLWELAQAFDDLRDTLDRPLDKWLRADERRVSALVDGRFGDLVDLAVNRAPLPRRGVGTSVFEGIAEDLEISINRTGGPLVTEDVEDGFAR